jgi:hypothetical protein
VPGVRSNASAGRILPDIEVRLVDDRRRDVPVGMVGEIGDGRPEAPEAYAAVVIMPVCEKERRAARRPRRYSGVLAAENVWAA